MLHNSRAFAITNLYYVTLADHLLRLHLGRLHCESMLLNMSFFFAADYVGCGACRLNIPSADCAMGERLELFISELPQRNNLRKDLEEISMVRKQSSNICS